MHFIFDWEKKIISINGYEIDFEDFEDMLEDWLEFMKYKKET